MPDTASNRLTAAPLGPAIGARVQGIDLSRPLTAASAAALETLLVRHQVLFFENQPLTPAQQRAFAASFGPLHVHPIYPNVPDFPEIMVLDTGPHNPSDNDVWHTDVTFLEAPPAIVVLSAKKVPPIGGDTVWSSAFAAYEALSEPLRRLLEPLQAVHDFTRSFPEWRHNAPGIYERWLQARAKHPVFIHPVVRTHPVDPAPWTTPAKRSRPSMSVPSGCCALLPGHRLGSGHHLHRFAADAMVVEIAHAPDRARNALNDIDGAKSPGPPTAK